MSVDAGMRALLARREAELRAGARPVGWKIGINVPAVQERLGIAGSVVGYLTSASLAEPGGHVDVYGDVLGPELEHYKEIFRRCSAERGIPYAEWAMPQIYQTFYKRLGIEPRACHPRDILDHFIDIATFLEAEHVLTPELLDRACRSYFLDETSEQS